MDLKKKHINLCKSTTLGRKDCQNFCGQVYRPICGSDGDTYSSECMLNFRNCLALNRGEDQVQIVHSGKCIEQVFLWYFYFL